MSKHHGHTALKQHLSQMSTHRGRRLLIVMGMKLICERSRGLRQPLWRSGNVDQNSCAFGQDGPIANGKKSQSKIRKDTSSYDGLCSKASQCVVAVATRKFLKEIDGVLPRNRQFDRNEQFLRRQRRLKNA